MSKEKKTKKKGRVMWGFIYVLAFIVTFVGSAIFKIAYNPYGGEFSVDWNDSVGTVYTDLSYGNGEANKFDLYVPADASKDSYGLIVYLHAGGFTGGDKADDSQMLQWLCSKGYVTAGINYTLFSETHPDASVYSQSMEIKESMPYVVEEANIPHDYYLCEHSGHGLQNDNKVYVEYMRKTLEYLDAYMPVK